MLEYILLGGGLAFAATIQPGPFQAFILSSVAQRGWKRTLPAALSPVLSDGPIAVVILFVINRVPALMSTLLQTAGGLLLLYLGWGSYKTWRAGESTESLPEERQPSTLLQAVAINLLNPNPYLGWSMVLGPALLEAWNEMPLYGITLLFAFYATLILGNAIIIILLGTSAFLTSRARHTLIWVSAVTLAALGAYRLVVSLLRLAGG